MRQKSTIPNNRKVLIKLEKSRLRILLPGFFNGFSKAVSLHYYRVFSNSQGNDIFLFHSHHEILKKINTAQEHLEKQIVIPLQL
jgi:hypothetical protein